MDKNWGQRHLVDAAERRLRLHFPAIQRVIGHAEPRR
jgi:hypothetical protein